MQCNVIFGIDSERFSIATFYRDFCTNSALELSLNYWNKLKWTFWRKILFPSRIFSVRALQLGTEFGVEKLKSQNKKDHPHLWGRFLSTRLLQVYKHALVFNTKRQTATTKTISTRKQVTQPSRRFIYRACASDIRHNSCSYILRTE